MSMVSNQPKVRISNQLVIHWPSLVGGDIKANPRSGRRAPPGISFDRFVRACVVVKQVTESFAKLDSDRDGWIQINYDQFMQTVLTLP
jgi:peflin